MMYEVARLVEYSYEFVVVGFALCGVVDLGGVGGVFFWRWGLGLGLICQMDGL